MHLYNWGEPTHNKNLIQMLQYCNQNHIWTRISSNLSLEYKENYLEDLLKSGLSYYMLMWMDLIKKFIQNTEKRET